MQTPVVREATSRMVWEACNKEAKEPIKINYLINRDVKNRGRNKCLANICLGGLFPSPPFFMSVGKSVERGQHLFLHLHHGKLGVKTWATVLQMIRLECSIYFNGRSTTINNLESQEDFRSHCKRRKSDWPQGYRRSRPMLCTLTRG